MSLVSRYPGLAALPHMAIADLPTPLEPAESLAASVGAGELLIKRDDLSAAIYGGNKVRKLEYLLADARQQGCDAVVTFGAAGSNHALATAIYARRFGLGCYAVLTEQTPSKKVADTLRYHALLNTRLVPAAGMEGVRQAFDAIASAHPGGADRLYRVPWGGSSWLGTAGFVDAAFELAGQTSRPPDFVYAATGTMGTTAGLALGFRLLGWPTRVVGVRVTPLPVMSPDSFIKLFETTNRELHALDPTLPLFDDPLANVDLRDEFFGAGYAIPTEATLEAIDLAGELCSLKLEDTYTGKAMAGMIADARAGRLAGRRTVFWHTYNSRPWPAEVATVPTAEVPAEFQNYFR